MTAYPPIRLPLIGLYADLESLFDTRDVRPCQAALVRLGPQYSQQGVVSLKDFPTVLYFPDKRTFNHFLDDMKKNGCTIRRDAAPSGYGKRATLRDEISAEGYFSGDGGLDITIGFQLIPEPELDGVLFENMLPQKNAPDQLIKLIYRYVARACVRGVDGVPLSGFYVALGLLEFNRGAPAARPEGQNQIFAVFDRVFDMIDRAFAGGSGQDFATMATNITPAMADAIGHATQAAFDDALRGQTDITEPTVSIRIRFPMEQRDAVAPVFESSGGTVADETHDGTLWTLTGDIPASAFHSDPSPLAETLRTTGATVEIKD